MERFSYTRQNLWAAALLGLGALFSQTHAYADTLIADASGSAPLSGIAPLTVGFSAWNSTCVAAYSCQWHWDYGDGTGSLPANDDSGARDSTHHYLNAGTYTVTLTQTLRTPTFPRPKVTTTLVVSVSQGETLTSYVNSCKTQLGFNDADIPTNLNCAKGVLFAPPNSPINDFFVHARVTDEVDLALACRWVNNGTGSANQTIPPFVAARSIEMFLNNHRTNKTCFFKARDKVLAADGSTPPLDPSIDVVSPTVAAAAAPGTPAANYWVQPIELDRALPCTDCHVAGPFIATPRIAPFLAQFGLLNNGHDTYGRYLDANNNPTGNYQIVGSTFVHLSNMALANNVPVGQTCTQGCHSIGYNSTAGNILGSIGAILLPGITEVFSATADPAISVHTSGAMAPSSDASPYRWINRDTPGDSVDIETFTASKISFPVAHYQCGVPTVLEAHAVGSSWDLSTTNLAQLPDKLSAFNTREGMTCLNSDQPNGRQCNNYSISYLCSDKTTSGPYDTDSPTFGGDHEERFSHSNVCTPTSANPNRTAIAIRATTTVNGSTLVVTGPNDRLAQFSPTGLVCRNSDQPNGGQCSNYVARYRGCTQKSQSYLAKIKNAWTNPPTFTDRYLTTTNNVNGAETRAQGNNYQYPSQDWIVEIVSGTRVRLKDVWSGKYLTASNNNEQATVVVNNYDPAQTRQQWFIESVPPEVRLKNVGTGRYLTVGNYTTDPYFAPMYSQSLNLNWASQRWVIQ